MYHLIQLILQNLTFFALHLKNLTSFPKPLAEEKEKELFKLMREKKLNRVLFMATGALLSPTSTLQGESIPSVAHAISISNTL